MFDGRDKEKTSKRLIYIINMLKSRSCSAGELAGKFDVTRRTIYRDFEDIKKLFGENCIAKIDNLHYKLSSRKNLYDICFNTEELTTLFNSLENYPVKNKYYSKLISNIIDKIQANSDYALVLKSKEHAGYVFCSDRYKGFNFFKKTYKQISLAISKSKKIRIKYPPINKGSKYFVISPLGWICDRGFLYLIGFSDYNSHPEPFKIDQISNMEITDNNSEIPDKFTMDDYIKHSFGIYYGEIKTVKLLFNKNVAHSIVGAKRHVTQKITRLENGNILFMASIAGLQDIIPWILSFGGKVKVLEPFELIENITVTAKNILEIYQK